jgi:hypothetical protein
MVSLWSWSWRTSICVPVKLSTDRANTAIGDEAGKSTGSLSWLQEVYVYRHSIVVFVDIADNILSGGCSLLPSLLNNPVVHMLALGTDVGIYYKGAFLVRLFG